MINGVQKYVSDVDSIRVYKIVGKGHIVNFGKENEISTNDTIIIYNKRGDIMNKKNTLFSSWYD